MDNIEIGELTNLGIDLLLLPLLVAVLYRGRVPHARMILAATLCVVLSHAATIAEGFFLPAVFDAAEHLGILAAGGLYLIAFASLGRDFAARRRSAR